MEWGVVAQAISIFAAGLIAIAITIFVLASSLLGRAQESHTEELKRQMEHLQNMITTLQGANQALPGGLERQLDDAVREYKAARRRFEAFTVRGGVLIPSVCFLLSGILGVFAWGIAGSNLVVYVGNRYLFLAPILCIVALIPMCCGVKRLYSCLKSIENIAVTTEAVAEKSNTRLQNRPKGSPKGT